MMLVAPGVELPVACAAMTAEWMELISRLEGWSGRPVLVSVAFLPAEEPVVAMTGVLGVGVVTEAPDRWGDVLAKAVYPVGGAVLTLDSFSFVEWLASDDGVAVQLRDEVMVRVLIGPQ
jgi:hypothetical protein